MCGLQPDERQLFLGAELLDHQPTSLYQCGIGIRPDFRDFDRGHRPFSGFDPGCFRGSGTVGIASSRIVLSGHPCGAWNRPVAWARQWRIGRFWQAACVYSNTGRIDGDAWDRTPHRRRQNGVQPRLVICLHWKRYVVRGAMAGCHRAGSGDSFVAHSSSDRFRRTDLRSGWQS
ncbi:hypothetical protein D3C85_1243100 [compost metagenome]